MQSDLYQAKLVYPTPSKENYIQCTECIQKEGYTERCIPMRLTHLGNMRDDALAGVHKLDQ